MMNYQQPNLNVWKRGWDPWKYPCNWWGNIKHFFRTIKYSWQRVTKGYCDWDTWDLDSYYADLIHNTLLHLRDNTHGYPGDMTEKEWHDWLTETAECFYKGNPANECFTNRYAEEAMKLFDKWTWDKCEDGSKCHRLNTHYSKEDEILNRMYLEIENEIALKQEQTIKRGLLRLMDKWFNLWD